MRRNAAAQSGANRWTFRGFPALGNTQIDEIPTHQDALLRQPDECGIVRLAATMRKLDPLTANLEGQGIVIDLIRPPMVVRKRVAGLIELATHHQAVQRMRRVIALEALQDIPVRDDVRPRNPPGVGLLIEQSRAPCMVDMAVRVDDGMHRAVIPAAQRGDRLVCGLPASGVHQHKPVAGAERARVAEQVAGMDGDGVICDRHGNAAGDGRGPRLHRRLATPQLFKHRVLLHCAHPWSCRSCTRVRCSVPRRCARWPG